MTEGGGDISGNWEFDLHTDKHSRPTFNGRRVYSVLVSDIIDLMTNIEFNKWIVGEIKTWYNSLWISVENSAVMAAPTPLFVKVDIIKEYRVSGIKFSIVTFGKNVSSTIVISVGK